MQNGLYVTNVTIVVLKIKIVWNLSPGHTACRYGEFGKKLQSNNHCFNSDTSWSVEASKTDRTMESAS